MDSTRRQIELPFAEAEGTHAERRGLVRSAINNVRHDLALKHFVLWVFEIQSFTGRALQKSYQQIAEELCCCRSKAIDVVWLAIHHGMVEIERVDERGRPKDRNANGSKRANYYAIDWAGVLALSKGQRKPTPPIDAVATCTTQSATCTTQSATRSHTKETYLLESLQESVPYRSAAPWPTDFAEQKGGGPSGRREPAVRTEASADQERLATGAAVSVPELEAARTRIVEPLPAGELEHGVFKPIVERHLGSIGSLVGWYRRQLSARWPAVGPSEADLLLIIATARYALDLPAASVRSTRVAVFVDTVRHGRWFRVLPWIGEARSTLDAELERFGRGLLGGSVWPPQPVAK